MCKILVLTKQKRLLIEDYYKSINNLFVFKNKIFIILRKYMVSYSYYMIKSRVRVMISRKSVVRPNPYVRKAYE